jgi:hypothetical protein
MFNIIIAWLKAFWKNNICDDFPAHWPPECAACNAGSCDGCSVRKYPDSLGDLDEDEEKNINWSSGQDDVPPAPEGIQVLSLGKSSHRYIAAKDKDIEDAIALLHALEVKHPQVKDDCVPIRHCLLKALI